MGKLLDFGLQAGQSAIGAGMGLLLGKINDRRQLKQQEKLQALEIAGQKQLTDYNQEKALEMWEKTSYPGQKEQMKKAGLNPALMYGMSGGGGQTAQVTPGNVSGGNASGNSGEAMGMAMMAANLGLLKAQKENIEADTANKSADTANKGVQKKGLEADNQGKYLNNDFLQRTLEDRIDIINSDKEIKINDLDISNVNQRISRANQEANKTIVQEQANKLKLEQVLIQAQVDVQKQSIEESKARVEQMDAQIKKWAAEIEQQGQKLDIDRFVANVDAAFKGFGSTISAYLKQKMGLVMEIGKTEKRSHNDSVIEGATHK